MSMRFWILSAVVCVVVVSSIARGSDSEIDAAPNPATPVTVSISSVEMNSITDDFVLHARVANKSTAAVVVTLMLDLPEDIVVGPRKKQVQYTDDTPVLTKESFDLSSGESQDVMFRLAPLGWRDALRLSLFRYQQRELRLRARYEITPGTVEHAQPVTTAIIMPQAPVTGVALGALIGVIITVGFVFVYRLVRQHSRMATSEALLNVLLGSITVVIAAILFRFASVSLTQLPINVSVRDYIGGIVIGVLFQPMVDWFAKIIQADSAPPTHDLAHYGGASPALPVDRAAYGKSEPRAQ